MEGYEGLIQASIVVLVPALIGVLKVWTTILPKHFIPLIVIALGAGLQLAASYVTAADLSPAMAAVYGSASIGLRELLDQMKKQAAVSQ